MMYKKVLVVCFFLFLFSFGFAEITDLKISERVPLNQKLTIYGINDAGNVLCAFYIFDLNDKNQAIIRLSDEWAFADGSFYSEYQVTEPLLKRGFDYNAVIKCGSNQADDTFYVEQREDYLLGVSKDTITQEVAFWNNPETSLIGLFGFIAILFIICVLVVFYDNIFK